MARAVAFGSPWLAALHEPASTAARIWAGPCPGTRGGHACAADGPTLQCSGLDVGVTSPSTRPIISSKRHCRRSCTRGKKTIAPTFIHLFVCASVNYSSGTKLKSFALGSSIAIRDAAAQTKKFPAFAKQRYENLEKKEIKGDEKRPNDQGLDNRAKLSRGPHYRGKGARGLDA